MLRKILTIFIVMLMAFIIAVTITLLDAQSVETENATEGIAEISTKPSIVALATAVKKFSDIVKQRTP